MRELVGVSDIARNGRVVGLRLRLARKPLFNYCVARGLRLAEVSGSDNQIKYRYVIEPQDFCFINQDRELLIGHQDICRRICPVFRSGEILHEAREATAYHH